MFVNLQDEKMRAPSIVKRLFSEPLVHFLIAGLCLFGAYYWLMGKPAGSEAARLIRVTESDITWLRETWSRQNQRQPDDKELSILVADYLKEVMLAREAAELGLDDNDIIVRRRLAQKMEFLVRDTARLAEPPEDELLRLYENEASRFQEDARINFRQIFFADEEMARQGLRTLAVDSDAQIGDRTMLEAEYENIDNPGVAAVFGKEFSDRLFTIEPGSWQGPVSSAYGSHLVQITQRGGGRRRPFDEVRSEIVEEWHRRQQDRAQEQFYAELLRKYEIEAEESIRPLIAPVTETTK